jgi:leader peptidase (prepilin peptidase)/N-methyltransferase
MTATAPAAPTAADTAASTRRPPLTLATSVVAFALAVLLVGPIQHGDEIAAWAAMAIMLVAAAEDLRTRRLRNAFVAPALILAIAADPSGATLAAAVIAVVPFFVFAFLKPGSIGMGDVKFAAPAGALAGFEDLGSLLFTIAILGGLLSIVALVRFGRSGTLAYGPAIALATLLIAFVAN